MDVLRTIPNTPSLCSGWNCFWQVGVNPISETLSSGGDGVTPPDTREFTLTKEISQLKRLLAEKIQEIDFFRGALQKVEARRRNSESTGARASTTKSGK